MPIRQIFIDTETTGLSHAQGHRIIEIAAIEFIDGQPSGRRLHSYLDPERSIDPAAQRVHGLSRQFLAGKPRFQSIVPALADLVRDAECLMHNATFDKNFINAELGRCQAGFALEDLATITCTARLARKRFPGESARLDVLIARAGLGVTRGAHSALEDAELLARVYHQLLA